MAVRQVCRDGGGALAWVEALRGEVERAGSHVRSAEQVLPNEAFWISMKAPAAELALARGQPEAVRQMVDIDAGLPHVYPSFSRPCSSSPFGRRPSLRSERARTASRSGARIRNPSGGAAWLGADAGRARGVAPRFRARRVPVGGGTLRTGDPSGARGGSCRCVEHGCGTLGGAWPSLSRGVRAATRSRSGDCRGRTAGPGHGSPGVGPCHGRAARRPAVAEADRTGIPPGRVRLHGGRARPPGRSRRAHPARARRAPPHRRA